MPTPPRGLRACGLQSFRAVTTLIPRCVASLCPYTVWSTQHRPRLAPATFIAILARGPAVVYIIGGVLELRLVKAPMRTAEGRTKMRKGLLVVVLLTTALLLGPTLGFARGGGGWGAGHTSGGWHGGGGFHGHGGGGVVIGPDFWWGGPWWWGPAYPYYTYPDYTYPNYAVPPVYIQQGPAPPPAYWYYCPDSRTYYPYVKECASSWLTVVPPTSSPAP